MSNVLFAWKAPKDKKHALLNVDTLSVLLASSQQCSRK